MAEESVWRGASSQWKNFGWYALALGVAGAIVALCVILWYFVTPDTAVFAPFFLFLLIVPIAIALARYLQTKSKVYELTTERIKITQGVFNRMTDSLELYRVKDIEMRQPFLCRLVGLDNVHLTTSDASTPAVVIDAVPANAQLGDKIRNQVEIIRQQKRVREIDIE